PECRMNPDVVNQIDALLGAEAAPEDRRGVLAALAGLLQSARPIAIWLTDCDGGLVATYAIDNAALPDLSAVSDRLRRRLTERCNALIAEDACGSMFAVALSSAAGEAGMLAGLLAAERREAAPVFESQLPALRCGAALAWIAVQA